MKFTLELPTDVINDVKKLYKNADYIFSEMTQAGAEVVKENIKSNAPQSIKNSEMMNCLKTSKTYITKSDDGINTKVGFFGYFKNKKGIKTPAPLVANIFEYGRSNLPFPKNPFIRKSFKKDEINKVMMKKQKDLTGGLLNE